MTDHIEITNRGVFVIGHIESGKMRIGDRVSDETSHGQLTIAAIEFADTVSSRQSWVCLRFVEAPTKRALQSMFPVGSMLQVEPRTA